MPSSPLFIVVVVVAAVGLVAAALFVGYALGRHTSDRIGRAGRTGLGDHDYAAPFATSAGRTHDVSHLANLTASMTDHP